MAENNMFDLDTITVQAGEEVVINFENRDAPEILHGFAVYDSEEDLNEIFVGEPIEGGQTTTYTFDAPEDPGTYFFRDDIFPATMSGDFVVE